MRRSIRSHLHLPLYILHAQDHSARRLTLDSRERVTRGRADDSMMLRNALPSYVHYLPHGPPNANVYHNRSAAAVACSTAGFELCNKGQLEGFSYCAPGWTRDWAGYWFARGNVTGCTDHKPAGFISVLMLSAISPCVYTSRYIYRP